MEKQPTLVLKLGGSLMSDSEEVPFDFDYLEKFAKIIKSFEAKQYRFAIILGGGYMMRRLASLAQKAGIHEQMQLHWIGTTYNNVNAEIVRAYMHDICNERIIAYDDFYNAEKFKFEKGKSVIVGGGSRAGHSGDMDALLAAEQLNISTIISLKNIDGVYTADPKKDPRATRLEKISWDEYYKVIGYATEHAPGGNFPIDPVTSKQAAEKGKTFKIILGDDLANFEKVLKGEPFVGTTVGP